MIFIDPNLLWIFDPDFFRSMVWILIRWSVLRGYIDVGDGFWRRNVLITTIRCWLQFWPFWSPTSTITLALGTNIKKMSPTSKNHDVTNITVTVPRFNSDFGSNRISRFFASGLTWSSGRTMDQKPRPCLIGSELVD